MSHIWSSWKSISVLGRYTQGRIIPGDNTCSHSLRTLVNPCTGQASNVVVQDTPPAQVKKSIELARVAQLDWGSLPGTERRDALLALAQTAMDHHDELSALERLQTGKPLTDCQGEVDETISCLRYFAGYADKPRGTSHTTMMMHHTTQLEPIGVCGLITSFNYPLMLTGWKLAPALAAGNAVIIKPAPQTPLTTLALAELSAKIISDNVIQVLPGGLETGQAVVDGVDKTSFTGSTPAGQAIMRQATSTLQPLTLECGGKNTVIIDADADLASAAYHVAQGAFSNAGQNCCAVSRVLVHSRIHDAFIDLLESETKKWTPTNKEDGYSYGPLIDQQQYERVQRYVTQHSRYTPTFQAEQHLPSDLANGYFVPPSVYVGIPDDDCLATDEVFGPVLSVLAPFDSVQEAVSRANRSTSFGLAAGVFSGNYASAHAIASKLQTGIVWINTYNAIPASVPFGGRKLSGFGKDLGQNALDEFSFTKSVLHAL
ncbi:aldehyde dehydrogenase domain-containing protein [Chlamydoabsidia padenii]|nr:aldehyde dehydrogenase domain-containing protein [Chlamydoabsidia padenii]